MSKISYAEIFKMIEENKRTRANYYLYDNLKRDKFYFVTSSAFGLSKDDRQEVFDDAFSHFFEDIINGKYKYQNDHALFSYFYGGCRFQLLNKIRELVRNKKYLRYLEEMVHTIKAEEFENECNNSLRDFTKEKNEEFDMEFVFNENGIDFMAEEVMDALLRISGKCQTVIVLYYFLNRSHQEISEIYPEIPNENTSKSTIYRCRKNIKIELLNNIRNGKNGKS